MNVLTARLKNDEKKAELQESKIDTSISQNVLTAAVKKNEQQAQLNRKNLSVSVSEKINVIQNVDGVVDHDKLNNLDYEHSGHTGFASEARLNAMEQATVPKRLDALPVMGNMSNRGTAYLYVDNNGKSEKISIRQALATLIRTDTKKPDDMQVGEYLFLKKEK